MEPDGASLRAAYPGALRSGEAFGVHSCNTKTYLATYSENLGTPLDMDLLNFPYE